LDCRVLYHDKCFDGACSAALFTKLHRECVGRATVYSYSYQGLVHRAGSLFEESWWGEGENAIVDFKYSASPRLTWWFDHHQSAFASAEDEAVFRAGQADVSTSMRKFFDPSYVSCTGWIAHIASTRFGMDVSGLSELIHWADVVDGAKYESAQAAVEMEAPAMKLTLVIESAPAVVIESADDRAGSEMQVSPLRRKSAPSVEMTNLSGVSISQRFIPLLTEMPLQQVLEQPFVQELLGPLMERHWAALELIRRRATCERGVIAFDITDQPTEGYNKFIPYYLHPEGTYNVGLSKSSFRTKVSVGTNPWTPKPASELANIAAICERYGGGGHARVGAISFPVDREAEARAAAREIVAALQGRREKETAE
jgi:hypothetical protein